MEQRKAVELNSALTSLGFGAWSDLESSKYSFTSKVTVSIIINFEKIKQSCITHNKYDDRRNPGE